MRDETVSEEISLVWLIKFREWKFWIESSGRIYPGLIIRFFKKLSWFSSQHQNKWTRSDMYVVFFRYLFFQGNLIAVCRDWSEREHKGEITIFTFSSSCVIDNYFHTMKLIRRQMHSRFESTHTRFMRIWHSHSRYNVVFDGWLTTEKRIHSMLRCLQVVHREDVCLHR